MHIRTWGAVAVLALVGCGDDAAEGGTSGSAEQAIAEGQQAIAEAQAGPDSEVNPCEVFTEAMVGAVVDIPEGAQVEQRRGSGVTSKLCTYRWEDPNFDQEAHNREMMQKMQEALREGRMPQGIADMATSARSGAELSYTHQPESENAATARQQFESAMEMLNRGITRTIDRGPQKGQSVSFQFSTVSVEGVGDAAEWSERMHQLSVLDGRQVFHLSVKVAEDAAGDLELAKQLAGRLLH